MASTNIAELPVMSEADFTDNDRFLMVEDGKARLLPKPTFQSWLSKNVQGTKGEQGVAGKDGVNGKDGLKGLNGKDGLSAYQLAVSNGFVGTMTQWLLSLKGATGAKGLDGGSGWTPVIRTVARGSDTVLQLTDWVGGTGTKPTLLGYIGDTGIVANIASANNIKGVKGDTGLRGLQGIQGESGTNGVDGKAIESLSFKSDASILVTYTDATTLTSTIPPNPHGWATYKDGQYTDTTPFNIAVSSQVVIPNSATIKIENLPSNHTAFYNATLQKYLLTDPNGFYSVRVKFKVAASSQADTINISMSKATTDTPFSEDRALRGDGKIQDMNFNTIVYGDTALSTNGLTIQVKTYERAVSIYNIEVTIAKLI